MITKRPEFDNPQLGLVDIFAGSNTTGQVAQTENRLWLAFEEQPEYLAASAFRFLTKENTTLEMQEIYNLICAGKSVDLNTYQKQTLLSLF